jgi:thioredoxin 1
MKSVTTAEFEALGTGKIAVVFTAAWCKPCQALKPYLEEIEKEFTEVTFVTVDVDAEYAIPQRFAVRGVPTVMLMAAGEVKDRLIGSVAPAKIRESLAKL